MIDVSALHPNWRELRRAHMDQLRRMVHERHAQAAEARRLLIDAENEYKEIEKALNNGGQYNESETADIRN